MSITFYPSSGNHKPTSRTVKCNFCGPENSLPDCSDEVCTFCDGDGEYSEMDMPELNLANTNAIAMLDLVGVDKPDYYGSIRTDLIPEFRRNIIKLINVKSLRAGTIRESVKECNVYATGIDDEYIIDRLKCIEEILVYCQKHNENFCWG